MVSKAVALTKRLSIGFILGDETVKGMGENLSCPWYKASFLKGSLGFCVVSKIKVQI
jgi:hypothetical protein